MWRIQIMMLSILAMAQACDPSLEPEAFGQMSVEMLVVDGCGVMKDFEVELRFDAVDECSDPLFIRLQDSARPVDIVDGIHIEIGQWDLFNEDLKEHGDELSLKMEDPRLRCSLILNDTCSEASPSLVCQGGTLVATRLDPEGSISFRLDTNILDQRSGLVVGEGFVVEADFEVSAGYPHKTFSYCNEP
jgi:hypothetical protein